MARDRPTLIGRPRGARWPVLAPQHVQATCERLVGRSVIRSLEQPPCQSETGSLPKRFRRDVVASHLCGVFHARLRLSSIQLYLNLDERIRKIVLFYPENEVHSLLLEDVTLNSGLYVK